MNCYDSGSSSYEAFFAAHPDMSLLQNIRPANRYRLSVLLAGFLVIQTFLPMFRQLPEWQSLAGALLWMTLGGIAVGIGAAGWMRLDARVSAEHLRFLVMAAILGLPMCTFLYLFGPESLTTRT
jgi:hypothetical protein